jgi:hypothetical protein
MAERFVEIDRNTPMLLPADLRDWVPEDDLVHFVIEAVKTLPAGEFVVNERGTGYAQYTLLDQMNKLPSSSASNPTGSWAAKPENRPP